MSTPRHLAALLALLMLLSTAAFVIGVSVEKSQRHSDDGVEEVHTDEESGGHEEGTTDEGEGASPDWEESESIGGIDAESTPLVVLGAALSLALAGVVLRWPRREVFAVAAVFCIGFALLDGVEVAHQLGEDSAGVAALAGLTLALHLAAAAVAGVALAQDSRRRSVAATA